MTEFLTDDRVKVIRRLLLVTLGFAVLCAVLGIVFVATGDTRGGLTVLVIAVIIAALGALALRAVDQRSPTARRTVLVTAIVLMVLSVPLVGVVIGLLTAITGIGLLAVTIAPEREAP